MIKGRIQYPECNKGGFHSGELMNYICLDCKENKLSCSACIEDIHKSHKTRPIKIVINEIVKDINKSKKEKKVPITNPAQISQQNGQETNPETTQHSEPKEQNDINIKILISLVESKQKQIVQNYDEEVQKWQKQIKSLRENIIDTFESLKEEIKFKSCQSENLKQMIDKIYKQENTHQTLEQYMNKLVEYLPEISPNIQQLTTENLTSLINEKCNHISEDIQLKSNRIQEFALLEANTTEKSLKQKCTFAFKINKNHVSNWVALGVCHKEQVQKNSFNFPFNQLGHGAYMISTNGGSWSHADKSANDVVKTFKYTVNDVIIISFDPEKKTVSFQKQKNDKQIYTLELQSIDDIYPCALFYYQEDQIEFINNYQQQQQ